MFDTIGKITPVGARFSTVGGESGSADTARDPRGYAVKFYTEGATCFSYRLTDATKCSLYTQHTLYTLNTLYTDGNWDLVGNNTPIFFIRDPMLFPSFIHTQKRNPATHCKDPDAMWDFISLRPETVHQVSILFSDRGTPDGYRYNHYLLPNKLPFYLPYHLSLYYPSSLSSPILYFFLFPKQTSYQRTLTLTLTLINKK